VAGTFHLRLQAVAENSVKPVDFELPEDELEPSRVFRPEGF
jgi:hypothetical protein